VRLLRRPGRYRPSPPCGRPPPGVVTRSNPPAEARPRRRAGCWPASRRGARCPLAPRRPAPTARRIRSAAPAHAMTTRGVMLRRRTP
jgi:hypothetical protein